MSAFTHYLFFVVVFTVAIGAVVLGEEVDVAPPAAQDTPQGGETLFENTDELLEKTDDVLDDLDQKYGASHDSLDDSELDKYDEGWTSAELQNKMIFCFDTAQTYITSNREQFEAISQAASKEKGIREDDALRIVMFGALLSCYFTLEKHELGAGLSVERQHELVFSSGDLPSRMSAKQMALLEATIIEANAGMASTSEKDAKKGAAKEEGTKKEKEKPDQKKEKAKTSETVPPALRWKEYLLTGTRGKILGVVVVGSVGCLLYWILLILSNMENQREYGGARKFTKAEKKLRKKRG